MTCFSSSLTLFSASWQLSSADLSCTSRLINEDYINQGYHNYESICIDYKFTFSRAFSFSSCSISSCMKLQKLETHHIFTSLTCDTQDIFTYFITKRRSLFPICKFQVIFSQFHRESAIYAKIQSGHMILYIKNNWKTKAMKILIVNWYNLLGGCFLVGGSIGGTAIGVLKDVLLGGSMLFDLDGIPDNADVIRDGWVSSDLVLAS